MNFFRRLALQEKETWWQLASRCCWNRARPWHASELVSFLVGLRTYQHPVCVCIYIYIYIYIYTRANNCNSITYNDTKCAINIVHVAVSFDHLQGGIQQRKIHSWLPLYSDMRRLTTVMCYEKCVVRQFRRCANVIECTYTNLDSTV